MPADSDGRPDRGSVRIVLDLDLEGSPPRGRFVGEEGSARAFFGWLQLMDGLEDARRHASAREPAHRSGEAPGRPT
jgi:hypothetical protein